MHIEVIVRMSLTVKPSIGSDENQSTQTFPYSPKVIKLSSTNLQLIVC